MTKANRKKTRYNKKLPKQSLYIFDFVAPTPVGSIATSVSSCESAAVPLVFSVSGAAAFGAAGVDIAATGFEECSSTKEMIS